MIGSQMVIDKPRVAYSRRVSCAIVMSLIYFSPMWIVALLLDAPHSFLMVPLICTIIFISINIHKVKYHIIKIDVQDDTMFVNYQHRDIVCEEEIRISKSSITLGSYMGRVANYHLIVRTDANVVIRQHAMCGWKYEDIDAVMSDIIGK